jgi:hypothetical protein
MAQASCTSVSSGPDLGTFRSGHPAAVLRWLGGDPMDHVLKVFIVMFVVSVTAAGWTLLVRETAWLIAN